MHMLVCHNVDDVLYCCGSAQYMAWVELVVISVVTPNASFLGHLAGILAGLAHLTIFDRGAGAAGGGFAARLRRRLRRRFSFRRPFSGVRSSTFCVVGLFFKRFQGIFPRHSCGGGWRGC